MAHGKNISIEYATSSIAKFVNHEISTSGKPEDQIVVGHRIDLSLMKRMIASIDELNSLGNEIDSIRIYHGINNREIENKTEEYDVILVPTHSDGKDYHIIYKIHGENGTLPTLIGNSTPCPNVCEQITLNCRGEAV